MGSSFAGLTASEYNDWRETADLQSAEKKLVWPLICRSSHKKILDLGCGTGLWSRLAAEVHSESSVVGVDVSPDMIACAQKLSEPRLSYLIADCSRPQNFGAFDLIICGMSADYIGFPHVVRTVASSLTAPGQAYIWILDPSNYEKRRNEYVK